MKALDIIGYTLEDAKSLLLDEGVEIAYIKVTSPPKMLTDEYSHTDRIICVREIDTKRVGLIVCKPL